MHNSFKFGLFFITTKYFPIFAYIKSRYKHIIMKTKALYLLVGMFLLASCTDSMHDFAIDQPQSLKQIVMTTQDFETEPCSRTLYQIVDGAVTCTWADNDTVGVFPNEGLQTCFPMTSEA